METVNIMQYSNRKLYVSPQGYVNLSLIDSFLRDGKTIKVTYEPTREDITEQVLKSIAVHRVKQLTATEALARLV